MSYTIKLFLLSVVTVFLLIVFVQHNTSEKNNIQSLKEDAVILSFGDSLTYGFGAPTGSSYPDILERLSGLKVINAGVNGELSSDGVKRLPSLLTKAPDLVILCHGGNDIIQGVPSQELQANLLAMIEIIQASGAQVLLVGIPDFTLLGLDTHEVYYEVAKLKNLVLEDEALEYIEARRNLKSDYIHPNKEGYEIMAKNIYEILKNYKFIQ